MVATIEKSKLVTSRQKQADSDVKVTKAKLRVGILLDDYSVPAWSYKMFESIINSDYAEISLIVLNDNDKEVPNTTIAQKLLNNRGRFFHLAVRKVLEITYDKLIERNTYLPDASESRNCEKLFKNTHTLAVKTDRGKWSDYFKDDDTKKIQSSEVDIIMRCGFRILRGDILTVAKYGVWSFHHGDNLRNRGGPAGYWESMQGWPETGSILQILTEDLDNGNVLYRSYSSTNSMSVTDNASNYFWKSLSFMTRKMEELHRVGGDHFFAKTEHNNRHPTFYSERLYVSPTNWEFAVLVLGKIREKIRLLYENKFKLEQWILMFHLNEEFSSSLWRYKKIIPPKDRFWADPHVINKDGMYYIFIEEYMYDIDKGHISLITMDAKGNYSAPEPVLKKPYHLSYPFIMEHENDYYMIPESLENGTIELYKCTGFPNKWEFQMNLMENIKAVDATLLHHEGKWWIFANVIEHDGASTWDELFLYHSEELFSTNWTPHTANPVVSDCKSSRPAGKIFTKNGSLYRPSQNSSGRYGYGFNICEIKTLTETKYSEEIVSKVEPNWDKSIVGTHTFNREGGLHIIDALYKRKA